MPKHITFDFFIFNDSLLDLNQFAISERVLFNLYSSSSTVLHDIDKAVSSAYRFTLADDIEFGRSLT